MRRTRTRKRKQYRMRRTRTKVNKHQQYIEGGVFRGFTNSFNRMLQSFKPIIYKPLTNEELKAAVDKYCNDNQQYHPDYGYIGNWDVSSITNMQDLFFEKDLFNEDISKWDVSNVTDMSGMFEGARLFNQPLNSWNVSNVTNMSGMFERARSFNQPLNSWNVSNVTYMNDMFKYANAFNQPLNSWNVSNVTDMSSMFEEAINFNQPLNNWNVSNVTNMSHMFDTAKSFNQPLGYVNDEHPGWDVSNVTNMFHMFFWAEDFNQPLDSWEVDSNYTNIRGMFYGAIKFAINQNLGSWNLENHRNTTDLIIYPHLYPNFRNKKDKMFSQIQHELKMRDEEDEDVNIEDIQLEEDVGKKRKRNDVGVSNKKHKHEEEEDDRIPNCPICFKRLDNIDGPYTKKGTMNDVIRQCKTINPTTHNQVDHFVHRGCIYQWTHTSNGQLIQNRNKCVICSGPLVDDLYKAPQVNLDTIIKSHAQKGGQKIKYLKNNKYINKQ